MIDIYLNYEIFYSFLPIIVAIIIIDIRSLLIVINVEDITICMEYTIQYE